ncbi:MAG TPA: LamG domain-containing protein [Candidatus Nanoarchaeia archaeon]|nr:LamG domain-containing protein [Candidatus Nanoarchaeia archaeon]
MKFITLVILLIVAGCIQVAPPTQPAGVDTQDLPVPPSEPITPPAVSKPTVTPTEPESINAVLPGPIETPQAVKTTFPVPTYHLTMDTETGVDGKIISYSKGAYKTTRMLGKVNNAWTFDGNQDYVVLTDKSLQQLNDFTIVLWLKPGDLLKRAHILWEGDEDKETRGENAGNGWGTHQEIHLSLGDELGRSNYRIDKLTFYMGDSLHNVKISTDLNTREWQHVAIMVKNADTKPTAEMFVSTTSRGVAGSASQIKRDRWGTLRFGTGGGPGPAGDSDRDFKGSIDEFAIYDRILTKNELVKLCRTQNNGKLCDGSIG